MGIEYLGLSSINGPLVILEGVQDAFFDEIVEFTVDGKTKKIGRIIELYEDKAVIQVFEGTENMSLDNTRTKWPMVLLLRRFKNSLIYPLRHEQRQGGSRHSYTRRRC